MDARLLYGLMYLEINLVASLLVLFIRIKTLGISRMVSQRNFSSAIDAQVVFFLSDTASVLMFQGLLPCTAFGILTVKTVYFFSTAMMCFCWFIYFEHLQGSSFVRNRRLVALSSCLLWVMGALLLVNLSKGILFYMGADGVYYRGPYFLVLYLLSYVYVLAACGHALIGCFQKKKLSQRRLLRSLALFPIAPAAAGILQFYYSELPLACVALSFATLILYQNWLDDMISVDPLTKLNNRKQLHHSYEQWQRHDNTAPLYLLLVDADKFKSINDTYGHIEGDAALVRVADALREACRDLRYRANIARYGGDEFAVLAQADRPEEIEALKLRLRDALDALNREAKSPYALTVSVGVAKAAKSNTLKELIESADTGLYEAKRAR